MKFMQALPLKSALLGGLLLAVPAFAAPVTGTLGFSGSSLLTFTSGGTSFIDFRPLAGGTFGDIDSDNRTDFFEAVGINEFGTIKDLSTALAPNYATVPVATNVSIDDFIRFASIAPTTNIRLTYLPLADCGGGGTCVGPFQLLQNAENVSVSINIRGEIVNDRTSATPDVTPFSGIITAQFLRTTVAAVQAGASSPGGITASSYSGAITASAIPEPESLTLIGIGLAAMLLGGLRSKNRAQAN